ncbi:hypothetical protein [uncultured Aquimarina sp.]|uniref:hypothetical protein n=1 Tax=uncultured Aquimarina sp. TaxID=575652 RepID=UPI00261CCF13|nr:hypothetical protein [uncultured Aquimarina sp.]
MKFELPFNEKIFVKQLTLNFDLVWEKNFRKNHRTLFWMIPIFILGGLIVYGGNNLGHVFLAIGFFYLINYLNYYFHYKKNKSYYFDIVKEEVEGYIKANGCSIFEFTENYLRYKDYKFETKINWEAFKNARVIKNNLFLDMNSGNKASYIIGIEEVGIEDFEQIIEFVKIKVEKHSIQ